MTEAHEVQSAFRIAERQGAAPGASHDVTTERFRPICCEYVTRLRPENLHNGMAAIVGS